MTSCLTASIVAPVQQRASPKSIIGHRAVRPLTLRSHRPFGLFRRQPCVKTFTTLSNATQVVEEADRPSQDPSFRARSNALVDELLDLIKNTDSGENISNDKRLRANDIIRELETTGSMSKLRPLKNPQLWGNYNVAYVSQGNNQGGPPAGGRFRSGIGRLLFRTTRLCQSVLPPDVVTNKIEALLFGFLPVAVGLRGNLVGIPEREGGRDNLDTVKVFFEPPELTLPGGINTRFGPPSSVVLTTTYVDERIRLGKGSRGSLFVFTRGGESDLAEMDQVGLKKTSPGGAAAIFAICAALVIAGGATLYNAAMPNPVKAVGVLAMLLGTALASVFIRGGIMDPNNYDRPEIQNTGAPTPA